ncbi:hypothetical protein C0995_001840 [Termitomyces sp. Mi166|nr:hypothetical protein C0995_001840 [Termitomyces sp. Mi166\
MSSINTTAISTFLSKALAESTKPGDNNWMEWAENMEMLSIGVRADWVTSGTVAKEEEKIDKALVAYIYASIESEQCYHIKGIKSATTAWSTLNDHLLYCLNSSYHAICTNILAQETEPDLAKIKSTLIGFSNSKYIIKSKFGNSACLEGDKGRGKTQREPVTDGFKEGKYTWCDKSNGNSCHCCGHDRHISHLCAHDIPTAIKDLILQGAKDHAHEKAHHTYTNLDEQDSEDDNNGLQVVHAKTGHAPHQL